MTASRILDTIRRHGGDLTLALYVDRAPQLELVGVRPDNRTLVDLIRDNRIALIRELRNRYLRGSQVSVRWS